MDKIVECVPNFSEGRNLNIIKSITDEISDTEGVKLLDVDPGKATNRTVVTFAGSPEGVAEAAFKAIKKASSLIDMRKHKGEHPRLGATDVVPFVPVKGVTMEECVEIARQVGKRVAEELKIPVYLYENAATSPERQNLSNIRKGEYEGLPEKLKDPAWKPDFGAPVFNERAGATVIGAREFLIAYNVNLNTRDKKIANKIAKEIRERGKIVKDERGNKIQVPGKLKYVKAIGWYIEEYKIAQISINLTNFRKTALYKVFETAEEEARNFGLRVTGSEIVGLVPFDALYEAGVHFLAKQGKNTGVPEQEIIDIAIKSLGLSDVSEFKPEEKIIEYRLKDTDKKRLVDMSIENFVDELSTDSPAPGGGSVSALSGSLAASLVSMVANLTFGKKKYLAFNDEMEKISQEAQKIKKDYLKLIDDDTIAFNLVMEAFRLPKKTDADREIRNKSILKANKGATLVPMRVLRKCTELLTACSLVTEHGNVNSVSDSGVAALQIKSAAEGAYLNILINLKGIDDKTFTDEIKKEADMIMNEVKNKTDEILKKVYKKYREA